MSFLGDQHALEIPALVRVWVCASLGVYARPCPFVWKCWRVRVCASAFACACVLVCVCVWVRARVRVCVCLCVSLVETKLTLFCNTNNNYFAIYYFNLDFIMVLPKFAQQLFVPHRLKENEVCNKRLNI